MCDVGALVAASLLCCCQALGHLVEGQRQSSYLVAAARWSAGRQVAPSDGLTRRGDATERGDDGAKQEPADEQRDRQSRQGRYPERGADARQKLGLRRVERQGGGRLSERQEIADGLAIYLDGDATRELLCRGAAGCLAGSITDDLPGTVGHAVVQVHRPGSLATSPPAS